MERYRTTAKLFTFRSSVSLIPLSYVVCLELAFILSTRSIVEIIWNNSNSVYMKTDVVCYFTLHCNQDTRMQIHQCYANSIDFTKPGPSAYGNRRDILLDCTFGGGASLNVWYIARWKILDMSKNLVNDIPLQIHSNNKQLIILVHVTRYTPLRGYIHTGTNIHRF